MFQLCKAYGQLRVSTENGLKSFTSYIALRMTTVSQKNEKDGTLTLFSVNRSSPVNVIVRCVSTKPRPQSEKSEKKADISYDPPSPYRVPGPRRYGYETKYFTGGLLPRGEHLPPISALPKYKFSDPWTKKKALFGQNDYIDILGDGTVKPSDLITGPAWLIGFRGNEMQRLIRQMKFQGRELAHLYPTRYHQIKKRVLFLYKRYNQRRSGSY